MAITVPLSVIGLFVAKTVGAFQMSVLGFADAIQIAEPVLPGTPLTVWVMAPLYAVGYGMILLMIELVRKRTKKANRGKNNAD